MSNTIWMQLLSGKKTYITVALGILYILGGHLGYWKVDIDWLLGVGLAAVGFNRAGAAKAEVAAGVAAVKADVAAGHAQDAAEAVEAVRTVIQPEAPNPHPSTLLNPENVGALLRNILPLLLASQGMRPVAPPQNIVAEPRGERNS